MTLEMETRAGNRFLAAISSIVAFEQRPGNTFTFLAEVDLSAVEAARRSVRQGPRPSYTAFVVRAVALALREFPYANARVFRRAWGAVVGTVSFTLDGPRGFNVDEDFGPECDAIRREGRRLAALWRLVSCPSCRGERKVAMALIGGVVSQAFEVLGCHTCLCSFHPRHEGFYSRFLNMRTIARAAESKSLKQAPAVLMRLDVETVPSRWLGQAGRCRAAMALAAEV